MQIIYIIIIRLTVIPLYVYCIHIFIYNRLNNRLYCYRYLNIIYCNGSSCTAVAFTISSLVQSLAEKNTSHDISILQLSRVHRAYLTICDTRHTYIEVYFGAVLYYNIILNLIQYKRQFA